MALANAAVLVLVEDHGDYGALDRAGRVKPCKETKMSSPTSHVTSNRTVRPEGLAEQRRVGSVERQYIHNETPKRLILKGDGDSVIELAPLERTDPLKATVLKSFNLEPLIQQNLLRRVPFRSKCRLDAGAYAVLGLALLFVILGLNAFLSWRTSWPMGSTRSYQGYGLVGLSAALLLAYPVNRRGLRRSLRQLLIAVRRVRLLQAIDAITRALCSTQALTRRCSRL